MNNDFKIKELERKVANLVMIGRVTEVDAGSARARVIIGELHTAFLPWLSPRIGEGRRDWAAPSVGEQVLVISRNGDPAQGLIMASLGSAANPNPSSNPRIFKTVFSDGAFLQIDLDTHEMSVGCAGSVSVTADKDIHAVAGGRVNVVAVKDVEVTTQSNLKAVAALSAEVAAPVITLSGNVSVTGTLSVAGATTLLNTTVQGTPLNPGGNQF
jgi:phage baseplate assembly protein V